MTALGTVLGVAAAAALSRAITALLFNTSPLDPATYAAVTVLLVLVSLLACWAPTVRAAQVDPLQTLRSE
jgi:ABC-type lipoprotein release transport system permease subunit